ncbi:glycosyltransferase family 4 protein [Metapseudomonas furukawaii]|uniref:glycosyltransferase family 4 protein n=1 Tax=Metapseudomonas furukawaii TaxID=1149133 RepID=UPI00227C3FC4|nr:glycosyltransferase family 4 protein [Pseudomonas furukawaii]WAG80599.1 glycosyltransferase family 4 protein [Pseudomonas furukawaii]
MASVVLLTTKYASEKKDAWLTNELAYSLRDQGYDVSVVVFSWLKNDPESSVAELDGINVVRLKLHKLFYTTGFIGTAFKVLVFPYWARFVVGRNLDCCDLLIANTPCITIQGLSGYFKRRYGSKSYLVLWDFFPFYLKDLGVIRNKLFFKFFWFLEKRMYQSFDRIGCMTPGNIDFLLENYSGVERDKVEILPLWTDQKPVVSVDRCRLRQNYGLPQDKVIAVYGGAMSIVQELTNILDLAEQSMDMNVLFLFIGRGTEKKSLEDEASRRGLKNVRFLDYVPREEYEGLVASCDLGLISLSRKLSVPSFPSKSIDYFKVSLPILASLDSVTDFGSILQNEIQAGYSVVAGNTALLSERLRELVSDSDLRKKMGCSGRIYYERHLSVESARNKILSII